MADLKPGDYVVHEAHGIGRFLGTREIAQGDNKGDFMLLEYAGDAKLYVPLARLDLIQKYRGAGEGAAPRLDRLGGVTWERTKSRVKAKMRDMADELLKLYAQRRMAEGFCLFARQQLAARVRRRVRVRGDQGSTGGHQADQERHGERASHGSAVVRRRGLRQDRSRHARCVQRRWATASRWPCWRPPRCSRFSTSKHSSGVSRPSRFASRCSAAFATKKEIAEVLEGLAEGKVDIVIGTHRMLSQDVEFRDLGLLVVDEEQRFGVRHKERIKQLKHNVDVLTMSATPIPRTLHMSLAGLRDMSVIETPPKDRLAIHTVVAHMATS